MFFSFMKFFADVFIRPVTFSRSRLEPARIRGSRPQFVWVDLFQQLKDIVESHLDVVFDLKPELYCAYAKRKGLQQLP
jgi:hypothetical protein